MNCVSNIEVRVRQEFLFTCIRSVMNIFSVISRGVNVRKTHHAKAEVLWCPYQPIRVRRPEYGMVAFGEVACDHSVISLVPATGTRTGSRPFIVRAQVAIAGARRPKEHVVSSTLLLEGNEIHESII